MREPQPALAALLPPVEAIDGVPDAALPTTLAHLLALQARVVARMAGAGKREASSAVRYVTQAEAAAMFGVPLSAVRSPTRRGRVPTIGRGKNRRLLPTDLARELEDCKRTGRPLRPCSQPRKKPLTATMPME